ncbi:protein kinase, putative [Aspergillus lentulus]|nr:protein kinase, putative [Aspergillus lentulus]
MSYQSSKYPHMAATLFLSQVLKGRRGFYTVKKQLQDCVWLATNEYQEKVVAKSVQHFRLQNKQDILLRFQDRTPCIRPLIEEFGDTTVPPTRILRYLDDRCSSRIEQIAVYSSRGEVCYKKGARSTALSVLYDKGFVHTGMLHLLGFCFANFTNGEES